MICCYAHPLSSRSKLWVVTLIGSFVCLALMGSCGNSEQVPPEDPNSGNYLGGGNSPGGGAQSNTNRDGGAIGVLINTVQPTAPHCAVTFIRPDIVLTAAHCIPIGANPSQYQVSAYSPVLQPVSGVAVQQIITHPNWNGDTSLVTQHLYAVTGTASGDAPLQTTPLYDLAVLKLTSNVPAALTLTSGPLPIVQDRVAFSSVYFNTDVNGERRGAENLVATDIRPSSFTTLMPSVTQNSVGGAAAVISNAGSGEIVVGIFAGGATNLGAVYTRIDAHRNFINDAISGVTTGNYTIDHTTIGNPTDPTNPTDPVTFDCAVSSDNFCDYACDRDIDCEMPEAAKLYSFGTPCTSNQECVSGVCLMFDAQNTRCSAYCVGSNQGNCPNGFVCRAAISGNLVCGTPLDETGALPPPPELNYFGADCTMDAQCSSNVCINYMGSRWCSERCQRDSDCPISYVCGAVTGGRGCVPPSSTPPPPPPQAGTTPPPAGSNPP